MDSNINLNIGFIFVRVGTNDHLLSLFSKQFYNKFNMILLIVRAIRKIHMGQRMIKPTIRIVRIAKTQISLRIRAVWSESSLIACAFYSLRATQRGINENPCHTGWIYRLIWGFAGYTGPFVGIVHWLICSEDFRIAEHTNGPMRKRKQLCQIV